MNDEWCAEMGYWPEFIPCEEWPDDVDEAHEAHTMAVRNRQTHNPDYEGEA